MVIYPTIDGNPRVIASPMGWAQRTVLDHTVGANAAFAVIQLLLGLAIAYRPTVKLGLAASLPWAIAVWWFGEGLGGVLSGGADPLTGAPGGVILYALLAVLLWPVEESARAVRGGQGRRRARGPSALAAPLWASFVHFTLRSYRTTAPGALSGQITGMADDEQPNWLTSIINHAVNLTNNSRFGDLDPARRAVHRHWRLGLSALAAGAPRLAAGRPRVQCGDLGGRPGLRRRVHRHGHRPEHGPAARPARSRLLAAAYRV